MKTEQGKRIRGPALAAFEYLAQGKVALAWLGARMIGDREAGR